MHVSQVVRLERSAHDPVMHMSYWHAINMHVVYRLSVCLSLSVFLSLHYMYIHIHMHVNRLSTSQTGFLSSEEAEELQALVHTESMST